MALLLRKIKKTDLENIIKWRMFPQVTKYMYTDPILNIENQRKWLKRIEECKNELHWIIEIDNISIGILNITDINNLHKRCTWAYYIGDTSFRGRGIATTLECNIYNYVFETLKLNKLCCEVLEFNDKVVSIHKKFGSEVEGILKEHILKNGKFNNVVSMAITASKWNDIKHKYNYEKIYIE